MKRRLHLSWYRYALVVNMKGGDKRQEQPSDVRLALQLLRVLDLTDAGGQGTAAAQRKVSGKRSGTRRILTCACACVLTCQQGRQSLTKT
jgi:hypothetical protein